MISSLHWYTVTIMSIMSLYQNVLSLKCPFLKTLSITSPYLNIGVRRQALRRERQRLRVQNEHREGATGVLHRHLERARAAVVEALYCFAWNVGTGEVVVLDIQKKTKQRC